MRAVNFAGFRNRLFRSKLYNLVLSAEPVRPNFFLPLLFKGDADYGRTVRVGDLINSLKIIARPSGEKELATGITAHIHRFRWLADLDASGLDTAATVARELTALWADVHSRWNPLSWSVDVTAERLGFWLLHAPFLMDGSDAIFQDVFFNSLHRQMRHLQRASVFGTPLRDGFTGAKAEIFYDLMFGGRHSQLAASQTKLASRIDDEIVSDGGHRSRNPTKHMSSLRNLIEIRAALTAAGHGTPVWLQTAIDRMAPMLRTFRHGDGRLCLFNGARPTTVDEVNRILHYAEAKGRAIVNALHSGFQRLSAGQTVVIMDTGVPSSGGSDLEGQDESAGTLAFEFSSGRRQIVVNCGTPAQAQPALHEICRGSAAHSSLVLANTNSSELRSPSSMGKRRARRSENTRQEIDKNILVEAEHDGYRAIFGLLHGRALYLSADGLDIRGEDTVRGERAVDGVLRFHLHPDIVATLVEGGKSVLLRAGKTMGWRFQSSARDLSLEDSVYFGDGPRRPCQQIAVRFDHLSSATTLKWRFQKI